MARRRKVAQGLGERLESLIPEGQTIAEFSASVGVSDRTIGTYLRGESEPNATFLAALHRLFGVSIDWLVTGEGSPGGSEGAGHAEVPKDTTAFRQRLHELRDDLSDAEFARRCGIPYTTLKGYLSGKVPSLDKAARIAGTFGRTIDWLNGDGDSSSPATRTNRMPIPQYSVQAAAGTGAVVLAEDVDDYFVVSPDWLSRYVPRGAKVGIIEARGDSMEPTIHDGDILLVNFSIDRRHVDAGGVFVVSFEGGLVVKRLQMMTSGTVRILSDNDYYGPEEISREDADERMSVLAQVVWVGGAIRRRPPDRSL